MIKNTIYPLTIPIQVPALGFLALSKTLKSSLQKCKSEQPDKHYWLQLAIICGELMREYLSQVVSVIIIAFLVWRVETLQELEIE